MATNASETPVTVVIGDEGCSNCPLGRSCPLEGAKHSLTGNTCEIHSTDPLNVKVVITIPPFGRKA